jgi:hypothetical protein
MEVLTVPESRRTVDEDIRTMDIFTGLVVFLAAAAMVRLVVSPGTPRVLDLFGAGFLPYRDGSAGWPRGVQEEEPIAWAWTAGGKPRPPDVGSDDGLTAPELIDMTGDAVPSTRVGPSSMVPGIARRRR